MTIPRVGNVNGQNAVKGSTGPLARSVDDLALLMEAWCRPRAYELDASIPRLPWDQAAYESVKATPRLRFGFFTNDGFFDPAPACVRAVTDTVEALRREGHEVVEFPAEEFFEASMLYVSLLAAEGNMRGFVDSLEGEALHPNYIAMYLIANTPPALRGLIRCAMAAMGQPRIADLLAAGRRWSSFEFWANVAKRDKLRDHLMERWADAGLDALLCPALGLPALHHGTSVLLNQACCYTFVWNNFDFPAGTVPVTRVRPDEEVYVSKWQDKLTKDSVSACKGSTGLPVGVQVVTLPWRDELCLSAMHIVEAAVNFEDRVPPFPPMSKL